MQAYIIRRILLTIPTLLIVSVIVFLAVRLIPGDIIDVLLSDQASISWESDQAQRKAFEKKLGLDKPAAVQFMIWLSDVLRGDLGNSLWRETPISDEIIQKIPVSVELGFFGIVVALLISFPIGVYSAIRQDSPGDYIGRSIAMGFIAIPNFWLGIMAVVFPSIWFGWSPAIRYIPITQDPLGNLVQFALPGVILGMGMCGTNMRMIRTMMLEVLRQDYIRTAWSKGLRERVVVLRHALKNALIPVVTLLGLALPVMVGGTVILEQIFGLPGMGRLLVTAATQRDYTVISSVVLVIASAVVFVNLAVDLLYGLLDPRIRY